MTSVLWVSWAIKHIKNLLRLAALSYHFYYLVNFVYDCVAPLENNPGWVDSTTHGKPNLTWFEFSVSRGAIICFGNVTKRGDLTSSLQSASRRNSWQVTKLATSLRLLARRRLEERSHLSGDVPKTDDTYPCPRRTRWGKCNCPPEAN